MTHKNRKSFEISCFEVLKFELDMDPDPDPKLDLDMDPDLDQQLEKNDGSGSVSGSALNQCESGTLDISIYFKLKQVHRYNLQD